MRRCADFPGLFDLLMPCLLLLGLQLLVCFLCKLRLGSYIVMI